jgi:hypothetical protein
MWENDTDNKGRILAKVRCDDLREIPKSVRFTEGEGPDAESWTFSIEVLQQVLIGGGPPAEDPMPNDGGDPHPLPILNAGPINAMAGNIPADENAEWEDGHWAFNIGGNVAPNAAPNAGLGPAPAPNAALQNLFDAMDEDVQANQPLQEDHSNLTVTLSISEGDNSVNIPAGQAAGQEVEQDMEDMFVEEEINNGPVIVQGDLPAANFDDFIQLGEGVQNIMLAYFDVDAENPEPQIILLLLLQLMMLFQ